jgi:hypothetical protein
MKKLLSAVICFLAVSLSGLLAGADAPCEDLTAGIEFCPHERVVHLNRFGPGFLSIQFEDPISQTTLPGMGIEVEILSHDAGEDAGLHWADRTWRKSLIAEGLEEIVEDTPVELNGVEGRLVLTMGYFLEGFFIFEHNGHAALLTTRERGREDLIPVVKDRLSFVMSMVSAR